MGSSILVCFVLTLLLSLSSVICFQQNNKQQEVLKTSYYNFDLTKINDIYHKAAINALIRMKGNKIVLDLGLIDKNHFDGCIQNARSTPALAKCVVVLFDKRDNLIKEGKIKTTRELHHHLDDERKKMKRIFTPQTMMLNDEIDNSFINPTKRKFHLFEKPITYKDDNIFIQFRRNKRESEAIKIEMNQDLLRSPRFLNIIKQQNEEMVIPRNLRLLKKLENYKKMSDHVQRYQEKLNKESEKALSMTKNKAKFMTRDEPVENKKSFDILENLMNFFEDMLKKQSKFSLMSPKILNVMPDCMNQKKCNSNKKLFSPTIFSFHKDGFFSLPDIMDKIFDNEREKNRWLSFVLKISGSSDALEKAIKILGPRIDEMENKIYPAINKIENMERHFQRVIKTYNFRQKRELQEHGYTFLNEKQLKMAYSGKNEQMIKAPLKDLIKLNRHQLEARIENDIRKLASYNDTKRIKRQTGTPEDPEAEGSEKHIEFITLEPFSFFNRINEPIFLEVLTLSPHAFINELNSPLLLTAEILSPRAFISAVTSPNLLLTRILSPAAFISEILSPRMLTAYILSPETFVLEILTPKMLEARIFSPEILMVQVLSPTFLSPRIVSSEALAVLILSPNIMSPNIASRETLVLEVLSPHIMGGHENTESSEEVDHDAEPHTHEPHDHHSEFHAVHIHTYPFSHKQIPHAPLGEAFHISS